MIKITKNLVLFAVAFSVTTANAGINDAKPGYSTHANYDWFNQVVNNTPATGNVVDVDVNQTGYKVALQTSF